MQLTLSTDYALRTLIYLGARGDQLSTITEIAQAFDISTAHLMKVVNRLARQGYVMAIRGKGGGIRLARAPDGISVGEVVRDSEENLAVIGCLEHAGFCRIERCCILMGALSEATSAFLRVLVGHTLADLLEPRAKLVRDLNIHSEESRSPP